MPQYRVSYTDGDGNSREGVFEAQDRDALDARMRSDGNTPIGVQREGGLLGPIQKWMANRGVTKSDVIFSMRRMAILITNGVDLATALDGLCRQTSKIRLRDLFQGIRSEVLSGDNLSDCMRRRPEHFPAVATGLAQAGEASGTLGDCLAEYSRLGQREIELKGRLTGAFMYPAIVLGFSVMVVIGFLTMVLPKFIQVFASSGVELPLPTRILIGLNVVLVSGWPVILLGLVLLALWVYRTWNTEEGRYRIDRVRLQLPLLGPLFRLSTLARITRALGSLLRNGVSIDAALVVVADVCDNQYYAKLLLTARESVLRGTPLSESLERSGAFPEIVLQMIHSGEASGALDTMLLEVGEFFDFEASMSTNNMTTMLEPILLLILGIVVVAMALGVMLPLFEMSKLYR